MLLKDKTLSQEKVSFLALICLALIVGSLFLGVNSDESFEFHENRHETVQSYFKELKLMGIDNFREKKKYSDVNNFLGQGQLPPLNERTVNQHVDFGFIRELEGNKLIGYVPISKGVPIGKSGVTIAAGFDIGQRSEKDLIALGLPDDLVRRFKPYCGKTKWNAIAELKKNPLKVTTEEAELINSIISVNKVRGIIDVVGEEVWSKMDLGLRTVLASVQFQYGSAKTKTPNFFKKVLSLDVQGVINHLENFGDRYSTRRKAEAAYLRRVSLNSLDNIKKA